MSTPERPASTFRTDGSSTGEGRPIDAPTEHDPVTGQPDPHHRGVVKRTTSTVKRIVLVVLGALIALFAVFNSQNVSVNWIFGDKIQTPLILVIAVTLVIGVVIGWIIAKINARSSD